MAFDFTSSNGMGPTITPLLADGATNRPLDQQLAWQLAWNPAISGLATSPSTDVWFDTVTPPRAPVIRGYPGGGYPATGHTGQIYTGLNEGQIYRCNPGPLQPNVTYYWAVVVMNMYGWFRVSPVYAFNTNLTPLPPSSPSPNDGGTGDLSPTLAWSSVFATSYDVYFGTSASPPLVSAGQAGATYVPAGPLIDTTVYFWKIVAINSYGSTTGPVWSFTAEDTMVIDRDVTLQDVVNTTTETTVYTFTVPGGTLSTNRALRLSLIGDFLNTFNSGQQLTVKIKYGGTQFGLFTSSPVTDANRRTLRGEFLLSAANATNVQVSLGSIALSEPTGITGGANTPFTSMDGIRTNGAIDSTASQTLDVTFQLNAANANLSARLHVAILEKL